MHKLIDGNNFAIDVHQVEQNQVFSPQLKRRTPCETRWLCT